MKYSNVLITIFLSVFIFTMFSCRTGLDFTSVTIATTTRPLIGTGVTSEPEDLPLNESANVTIPNSLIGGVDVVITVEARCVEEGEVTLSLRDKDPFWYLFWAGSDVLDEQTATCEDANDIISVQFDISRCGSRS